MKPLIDKILFGIFFISLFVSCSKIQMLCYSDQMFTGIHSDIQYSIELEKKGEGRIFFHFNGRDVKDSIKWKIQNGVIYFERKEKLNTIQSQMVIPSAALVKRNYIYFGGDEFECLLYNAKLAHFDLMFDGDYPRAMQKSGKEKALITRYFGDSLRICKRLEKTK